VPELRGSHADLAILQPNLMPISDGLASRFGAVSASFMMPASIGTKADGAPDGAIDAIGIAALVSIGVAALSGAGDGMDMGWISAGALALQRRDSPNAEARQGLQRFPAHGPRRLSMFRPWPKRSALTTTPVFANVTR
jgi:hypothetical protein